MEELIRNPVIADNTTKYTSIKKHTLENTLWKSKPEKEKCQRWIADTATEYTSKSSIKKYTLEKHTFKKYTLEIKIWKRKVFEIELIRDPMIADTAILPGTLPKNLLKDTIRNQGHLGPIKTHFGMTHFGKIHLEIEIWKRSVGGGGGDQKYCRHCWLSAQRHYYW